MKTRWDLTVGRKYRDSKTGAEKTHWTKVGAVFENKGGSLSILPDPGIALVAHPDASIVAWLPKDHDGNRRQQRRDAPEPDHADNDRADDFGDDEIPF